MAQPDEFAVRDAVQFEYQGRTVTGHIARKTRSRGFVVASDGGEYQVPWQFLQPQEAGSPKHVTLKADRVKASFRPGDQVRFQSRDGPVSGVIKRCGPKRALVTVEPDSSYRVPYGLLELAGDPSERDDGPDLSAIAEMAEALMAQHGLKGWSLQFGEASRRAGSCAYETKVITLTRLYCLEASEDNVRNTILHEIAHALAGPKHHHDSVWKETARRIGCTGDRCHDVEFAPPRYIISCPRCGWQHKRETRKRGLVCTTCKSPIRYRPYSAEAWATGHQQ